MTFRAILGWPKPEVHSCMTTAVHNMFAGATAVLLYSALVPAGHGAHSAWWGPAHRERERRVRV